MSTSHRSRAATLAVALLLGAGVAAPAMARSIELQAELAPAVPSWDESSGYGALETSRAVIGAGSVSGNVPGGLAAVASGIPIGLRYAPELAIAPSPSLGANEGATDVYEALTYGPTRESAIGAETSRIATAEQALADGDLGSLQEEALTTLVTTAETDAASPAEPVRSPAGE